MCAKLLQLCLTLCDPMDCNQAGSSAHGILQARILEWVAISSSRGSSQGSNLCFSCLLHWQVGSLQLAPPGKPSEWLSGKESGCQCRRHRFNPWSRKIPHALEQLSLCTTTTEPVL